MKRRGTYEHLKEQKRQSIEKRRENFSWQSFRNNRTYCQRGVRDFRLPAKQMADKIRQRWIKEAWATCRRASRLLIRGTNVYRETSGQNTREIGTRAYFSSVTQSVCAAVHLEPGPDAFEPGNSTREVSRAGSSHRTFNFIVCRHTVLLLR